MNGCDPGISQNRGCSACSEPFVIADDKGENQEQIADLSWRLLILATHGEGTGDRRDRNIFYVMMPWLLGCNVIVEVYRVEDAIENEVKKDDDIDSIKGSLFVDTCTHCIHEDHIRISGSTDSFCEE